MKTKMKIIFTVFIAVTLSASCYSSWMFAYNSATDNYNKDKIHCQTSAGIWAINMCLNEAEAAYDNALWDAGNEYIACDY